MRKACLRVRNTGHNPWEFRVRQRMTPNPFLGVAASSTQTHPQLVLKMSGRVIIRILHIASQADLQRQNLLYQRISSELTFYPGFSG